MDSNNSWFKDPSYEQVSLCRQQAGCFSDLLQDSSPAEFMYQLQVQQFKSDSLENKDAFSNDQAFSKSQKIEESEDGGGGKRDNNTVFKTSLSQFRKSILNVIKKSPSLVFLKREIKAAYGTKNQSVFPKLLSMVRALKITGQVLNFWNQRKLKLIKKKVNFLEAGKYTQKRLNQLKKTIKMMDAGLQEQNLQLSFDIYWGNYKQHQKYYKCKKQVMQFDQRFRRLYEKKDQRCLRSRKVEAQRGGKQVKARQTKFDQKKEKAKQK